MIFIDKIDKLLNASDPTFHSVCVKRDLGEGLIVDTEEESKKIYELIIPSNPTTSVVGLLRKNKKVIDQALRNKDYLIKLRSFAYFFSQIYFGDYPYRDGVKSFLSIVTNEIGGDANKLIIALKITVIGKPFEIIEEEVEQYIYQKIIDFNEASSQVRVRSCLFAFKEDPFILPGEVEPTYSNMNLNPLIHDFDFED